MKVAFVAVWLGWLPCCVGALVVDLVRGTGRPVYQEGLLQMAKPLRWAR